MSSFDVPCNTVCNLPPFKSHVTAQDPVTSDSVTLLQEDIEQYLALVRDALCQDLACIDEKLVELESRISALESP